MKVVDTRSTMKGFWKTVISDADVTRIEVLSRVVKIYLSNGYMVLTDKDELKRIVAETGRS